MYVIRDAGPGDFEYIWPIAQEFNTVSLPANREMLKKVLSISQQSFAGILPKAEREYVFLMEDIDGEERSIIGTSMIKAQKGSQKNPHVYFEIEQEQKFSPVFATWLRALKEYPEDFDPAQTLDYDVIQLRHTFDGPTELGGMFIRPKYRGKRLAARLSYARFLFIAMHQGQQIFKNTLLAEMLPDIKNSNAPFYNALGKKFTRITYDEADKYSRQNRWFLLDLFPRQTIYIKLLPQDAQDTISKIGKASKGAEKMLSKVGFNKVPKIHPLDGGPHYEAKTTKVPLVMNCFKARGVCEEDRDYIFEGLLGIVRDNGQYFQCIHTEFYRGIDDENFIRVAPRTLKSLEYQEGDVLWAQPWSRK